VEKVPEGLTLSTGLVFLLARMLGARVTSTVRSVLENKAAGGRATSLHLVGGALDLGRETSAGVIALLRPLCSICVFDEAGTAPHWHLEPAPYVPAVAVGLLLLVSGRGGE